MKSKILKLLGVVATVAIVASMLMAPVSAVSVPTLAVSTTTISATSDYTLTFNVAAKATAGAGAITLAFPTGASIAAITDVTLEAGPGLGTNAIALVHPAYVVTGQALAITTVAGQDIGAGAIVQVKVFGVVNPAAIGDYAVTVKTTAETTAVASNTFTATAPVIPPLPGVVTGKNSAGIVLITNSSATAINTVIHTAGVTTVVVGPGTYDEDVLMDVATVTSLVSSDGAATTIIKNVDGAGAVGSITVSVTGVTVDGFTVIGGAVPAVNFTAGTSTIKNCPITAGAGGGIVVNGGTITITACTVTAGANIGINVVAGTATIGGTITVGAGKGIVTAGTTTIGGTTITAATAGAGTGIDVTAGTATVSTSTLTALANALKVGAAATVTFNGNTVDACGVVTTGPPTIWVAGAPTLLNVYNNKITNSKYYVAQIDAAASAANVYFTYNNLTGSAKGFNNLAGGTLVATNNWWGAAAGAAAGANSTGVDASNPLGVAPTSGTFALGTTVTNGVVTVTSAGATAVAAAAFAANPTAIAAPAGITVVAFYDARVWGAGATTVKIAGTTAAPITAASAVVILNPAYGRWDVLTTTALNTFGKYIEATGTAAQFTGTPIALVTVLPVPPASPNIALGSGTVPALGATAVAIDATFAWPAVVGAATYDIVIAEDSTLADKFAVINYSATSPIAMHKIPADQILKYNTVYWWRVRSVSAAGTSAWSISSFTTMKEPPAVVTPPAPTTATVTIPVVTSVPAPVITVQIPTTEPVEVIPPYLLWAVVAVGIILVIAVVVLIVRTRRIS